MTIARPSRPARLGQPHRRPQRHLLRPQGRDWDATITKIVENPISIRQAFWSPYKKVLRWIEEQVAKRAAAADAGSEPGCGGAVATADDRRSRRSRRRTKIDIGVVAALGVAVGGITAALGALLAVFFGLGSVDAARRRRPDLLRSPVRRCSSPG